jgi:hypothetical protein
LSGHIRSKYIYRHLEVVMQIKQALIAIVAFLSAAFLAPQAQAVPAFARQVGMACSACHYQHFPVLNSFGRSFKENGFTLIGSQEKIEGDGLSIPVVMNAAFVGYMGYQKTNGPTAGGSPTTKTTNDGSLQIPMQVSLFAAGRAGEHIGYESEINISGAGTETAGSTGVGLIRLKVPMVYSVGNVNAGIVPFSTQGLGVADSFEVLNTGAVAVHAFNQFDMAAISAQQYIGTSTPANGVALIASNDDFFANFAKWGANQGGGNSGAPTSNYLRAAWTTGLIPGFDSAIGFQLWNGISAIDPPVTAPVTGVVDTKASSIDAQMMGDVGGMPLLIVVSYAKAPAQSGTNPNLFNANPLDRSSFNIGAELGVIPGKATLQVGLRSAKSGGYVDNATAASGNATDNALLLGVTYNLALNARLELTYSKYSGGLYNATYAALPGYMGDSLTTLDLAFGF